MDFDENVTRRDLTLSTGCLLVIFGLCIEGETMYNSITPEQAESELEGVTYMPTDEEFYKKYGAPTAIKAVSRYHGLITPAEQQVINGLNDDEDQSEPESWEL